MKDSQSIIRNSRLSIYLGADHAGFEMKEAVKEFLHGEGYEVKDCGNTKFDAGDDYPDFGFAVGRAVMSDAGSCGIVFCGSGVGMCLSANKVAGVRAACALGEGHAQSGKRDNDANVLCLASRSISFEEAKRIILVWLEVEFVEEERFMRRIGKIQRYERSEAIRTVKDFPKIKIIPAILEERLDRVYKKLALVEGVTDWVQVDIMDGKFVSEQSFDITLLETRKHPFFYEAHLMVADPLSYVEICARVGMNRVVFHWEAVRDTKKAQALCEAIAGKGMSVGVAIHPETESKEITDIVAYVDEVLVLGVHPGKSGQKMLSETRNRIIEARERFPQRVSIGVDGGITEENALECIEAGANRIVVGSALFGNKDPVSVLQKMRYKKEGEN